MMRLGSTIALFALLNSVSLSNPILQIHWDHHTLAPSAVLALKSFRNDHPEIHLRHIISPKYFLRRHDELISAISLMREAMHSHDQYGVYISAPKQLTERAKVYHRNQPSFWKIEAQRTGDDFEDDVPISVYTEREIERIISMSLEIVLETGLGQCEFATVHGFVMNSFIEKQLKKNGITPSPLSLDPSLTTMELKSYPMYYYLQQSWKENPSQETHLSLDLMDLATIIKELEKHSRKAILSTSIRTFRDNEHRLRTLLNFPEKKIPKVETPASHL